MKLTPACFLLVCLLLTACQATAGQHDPNDSDPTADDPPAGLTQEQWEKFQDVLAPRVATPDEDIEVEDGTEALEFLLAGNARFVAGRLRHDHESLRRRALLADGQHPYAVVLGCADSRVPPELIFDAGLGDLFVIRVAGNVVEVDEAGSIEYAVVHLHTPLVLVLGHEGCGAVTAALDFTTEEANELRRLLASIELDESAHDDTVPREERVHRGVEANVRESVARLQNIAEHEKDFETLIVGAVYELDTGRVRILK